MAKTDLKDKNGNAVYPQTKTEYVYDGDGNTLEERLQDIEENQGGGSAGIPDLQKYYDLGAQKMDTYNLVQEKVGIICIGQSNAVGRIPNADFPSTATINNKAISLNKSIPTCNIMQGDWAGPCNEDSKSFTTFNAGTIPTDNGIGKVGFDFVLYNAIANALGGNNFYVCKQARGNTSLQYQYATSFYPDIDKFKNNDGWYSQLYHLKCLVKRALELQPDIKFKAIIMHQGEADKLITSKEGPYYTALCRMIQWVRGLVGSPNLPFIFGSVPTNSDAFSQYVYNDMVRCAEDMDNVYMVDMGEASGWYNDGYQQHFSVADCISLADEMFKIMVNKRVLPKFLLDKHSIVSNGEATGATHQLSVTTTISVPASAVLQWSSSKSSVATVDANGLVTIVGDGTCTITAALRVNSEQNALYIGYEKCKVTVTNFNSQQS